MLLKMALFHSLYGQVMVHCIYSTSSSSTHLLMDIEVASMPWRLWIVLLWILECMCIFKLEFSPDIFPGVGLLDHMRSTAYAYWYSIPSYANDGILYSVLKHWVNFEATAQKTIPLRMLGMTCTLNSYHCWHNKNAILFWVWYCQYSYLGNLKDREAGLKSMGSQRVRHNWAIKQQHCHFNVWSVSVNFFCN